MATSRFQNLRAALASDISDQLTTDGVSGVTVTEYPPLGDYVREDRIYLAEIRGEQEPFTQGASGFRAETLEVDLVVYAPVHGGTVDEMKDAESRAETLFASVENAVRGDVTVSSTVFNIELDSFTSSIENIDEHGPVGFIEATLTAEAHI